MKKLSDDLVIYRTCSSLPEAQIIKIQLEQEGLHPEIKDEHMQTIASHLSSLLGNITLLLPEDETPRADEILRRNSESAAASSELSSEDEVKPVESLYDQKATYAKRAAFFGVLVVPILPTLYSLGLTLQCFSNWNSLNPKSRSSLWQASIVNILAIAAVIYIALDGFKI